MAKTAVGSMSDWSGVLEDFFRQIDDGSHTLEVIKAFNEHRNPFVEAVADTSQSLTGWPTFYHNYFDLVDMDFSSVQIPENRPGFDRLIIVAKDLTPNKGYEACAKNFPCRRYAEDLDAVLDWSQEERNSKDGHYAIWVRDRVEADEELKNISANQIKENGLKTETLLERLLHELKFWSETGQHLDIENITLCPGSRGRLDGFVPVACWSRDEFGVSWCRSGYFDGSLRAREVVS